MLKHETMRFPTFYNKVSMQAGLLFQAHPIWATVAYYPLNILLLNCTHFQFLDYSVELLFLFLRR